LALATPPDPRFDKSDKTAPKLRAIIPARRSANDWSELVVGCQSKGGRSTLKKNFREPGIKMGIFESQAPQREVRAASYRLTAWASDLCCAFYVARA
jgi:hypothetical protein